jgi:hypothetical protein
MNTNDPSFAIILFFAGIIIAILVVLRDLIFKKNRPHVLHLYLKDKYCRIHKHETSCTQS